MHKYILVALAASLYYSGLVALARWWQRRTGGKLIVLLYHKASGGYLQQHLLYLRKHYRILPLEEALEELKLAQYGKRIRDARPLLALTFDDGYVDNYTHAFMLAKELTVPFHIYLIPGYIERDVPFWWLEGQRMVCHTQVKYVRVDERTFDLNTNRDRLELATWIDAKARSAPTVRVREQFLQQVREQLFLSAADYSEDRTTKSLNWQEIQEMAESQLVTFGAHTMNHPILAALTDPLELQYEITACRAVLEQRLGRKISTLAYPVGKRQHISAQVLQMTREAGYRWAMTTHYGMNTANSDPYLLKRIEVDVNQHWLVVAAEAAGMWGLIHFIRWLPFVHTYLKRFHAREETKI